jgi:hypothetical protein
MSTPASNVDSIHTACLPSMKLAPETDKFFYERVTNPISLAMILDLYVARPFPVIKRAYPNP